MSTIAVVPQRCWRWPAQATVLRYWPAIGFAGAWFFVILAPTSSVVPLADQPMAEHRMYLSLAAVIALGYPVRRPRRLRRQPVASFTSVDSIDGPIFGPP